MMFKINKFIVWFLVLIFFIVNASTSSINLRKENTSTLKIDNQNVNTESRMPNFHLRHDLPSTTIVNCTFNDSQNNLWIGTRSNGLYEHVQGEAEFQKIKSIKIDSWINQIFQDKQNNIWVGTYNNGVWEKKVNTVKFVENTSTNYLNVETFYQDQKGDIWIGTEHGLLEQKEGQTQFVESKIIPNNIWINTIYANLEGNIWIGTFYSGLWQWSAKNQKFLLADNFPSNQGVKQILQDKQNNIWIAAGNAGLWEKVHEQTKFEKNTALPLAPKDGALMIIQSANGNILVGTYSGLWIKSKSELNFKQNISLPKKEVTEIYNDLEGNIWIGVSQHGLWVEQASERTYQQDASISDSEEIQLIFEDQDHDLWLGGNGLWDTFGFNAIASRGTSMYVGHKIINSKVVPVSFYQGAFSVSLNNNAEIKNIKIGKNVAKINKTYDFPNKKLGIRINQIFIFQINYKSGFSYFRYLCIKADYLDDSDQGKNSLFTAISSNGGKGLKNNQVYLGENKMTRYNLFFDLAKTKNQNPNMSINPKKLNFLTDFSKSKVTPITIFNRKIIKLNASSKPLSTDKVFQIKGENVSNLYQVDLLDHLGNRQSILVQEGGQKLNNNFNIIKNQDSSWKYIILIEAVIIIFLLSWIAIWHFNNQRNKKQKILKSNDKRLQKKKIEYSRPRLSKNNIIKQRR